jgi:hypothetical protein
MPDKPTTTDRREKTLHDLLTTAGQDLGWRRGVLNLIGELLEDNKKLRQGYANLKTEVEEMKNG